MKAASEGRPPGAANNDTIAVTEGVAMPGSNGAGSPKPSLKGKRTRRTATKRRVARAPAATRATKRRKRR